MLLLRLDSGSEVSSILWVIFVSQQVTLLNVQEAFLFASYTDLRTTVYKASQLLASCIPIDPSLFYFPVLQSANGQV